RDLLGDRPVGLEQLAWDTGERLLDVVGVDDEAAAHERRRARALGETPEHETARARLRSRNGQALLDQQRRHLLVDTGAIVGVERVGMAGADDLLERAVDLAGMWLEARDDLELTAAHA